MRTLALILRQGYEYCRQIREGVLLPIERSPGWQLLQLPFHDSGEPPAPTGLDSLDGVVTWTEVWHPWMDGLAERGIPIVNCSGGLEPIAGLSMISTDIGSVFDLGLKHFAELSLQRVLWFGQPGAGGRDLVVDTLSALGEPLGIEAGSIETSCRNPNENLDVLLTPENERELIETFASLTVPVGIFAEDDHFARFACSLARLAGRRVPADVAVIGVGGDLLSRCGDPTITTIPLPGENIGEKAFELIREFHEGKPMPHEPHIELPASTIIVRESTGGKAQDVAMERVFRWVEREACRGLTVQELSKVAGMSLLAMRRRYKKLYGMEPSSHIRDVRIAKAKRLLSEGDAPVAHVAVACGFVSQTAFYNYFHRHTGIAPTEYRIEASTPQSE